MAKRPGRTIKVSISLDRKDFELLKKRAKQLTGGNISAAITDVIHVARAWAGREELAAWLGEPHEEPTPEEMGAIRAEWRGGKRAKPSKRRKRAA